MEIKNLPFPWARLNSRLNITDSNDKFKKEFPESGLENGAVNFSHIAEGFDPKKNRQLCRIKGLNYIITSVRDGDSLEIFADRADFGSDCAVGLIFIDNLSERLDNVEEKGRGL
ncbi:MAG: hypothetical protein LUG24_00805 [Clostridiales bacterium]|nr:hypothetical protein [Clostridiales bacterium]